MSMMMLRRTCLPSGTSPQARIRRPGRRRVLFPAVVLVGSRRGLPRRVRLRRRYLPRPHVASPRPPLPVLVAGAAAAAAVPRPQHPRPQHLRRAPHAGLLITITSAMTPAEAMVHVMVVLGGAAAGPIFIYMLQKHMEEHVSKIGLA
ncbi:unnamed protein product [Ectocarpus sp. 6 AP-2014]